MTNQNSEIEKEKLKITLSFGIVAANFGLLKLVSDYIDKSSFFSGLLIFLGLIIFFTTLCFVSFILLLAAKYKNKEPDYIYFMRIGERTRNAFYDAGVDGFGIALVHGTGAFLGQLMIKRNIIEDHSTAYFIGLLIVFAIYFIFSILPRLIRYIRNRKKKLSA